MNVGMPVREGNAAGEVMKGARPVEKLVPHHGHRKGGVVDALCVFI